MKTLTRTMEHKPLTGPIRVVIADDHPVIRRMLLMSLSSEPDVDVVAEALDGQHAVELTIQLQPDVVLMDFSMPRLTGAEATRRITACCPRTKVVGLSMHGDMMAPSMRQAGAVACLSKEASLEEVIVAVRSAGEGEREQESSQA